MAFDPCASPESLAELRQWLATMGFSAAEIDEADAAGELGNLASDRQIRPGQRYTTAETIAASGLDAGLFDQVRRAAGLVLPPEHVAYFTDGDVALFRLFGTTEELFSREEVLHFTRVMASSLARIAETANSVFLTEIEHPHVAQGGTVAELSRKSLAATQLLDQVLEVMGPLFRLQMDLATARSRATRHGMATARMTVGFVDLVGFTPWTEAASHADLDRMVRDFEREAFDIVGDHDARVVKLIGDEVMFVAVQPSCACAAALELVAAFTKVGATPRGGLAVGDLVTRGGDYYGSVVNLASRIVDQAVPGEVLVSPELAAAAPGFVFEPAGRRSLKGFADPVPLLSLVDAIRPNDDPADAP